MIMPGPSPLSKHFGYWPSATSLSVGHLNIAPLPFFDAVMASMQEERGIKGNWIYAPPALTRDMLSREVYEQPFPSRIFGLPHTHTIAHAASDSDDHLDFHIWGLAFFLGMRFTSTEAGFVDATPVRPGKLVDFVCLGGLGASVELVERFWIDHRAVPERASLVSAAVHALFLSQGPQLLQYERFIYCYTALDACFALAQDLHPPKRRPNHAMRLAWMCDLFGMPTPSWAQPATAGSSPISQIRNRTMHEALYMGRPLGFAVDAANLPHEMRGLICRFIVAVLGAANSDYVRTPVVSRQKQGLRL
jgi:hypothetical protein